MLQLLRNAEGNGDRGSLPERLPQRAHLIGLAGCGMRSLAQVLVERGYRVSGSDTAPAAAATLATLGPRVYRTHAAEHVPADAELVIYSDAVGADNPERRRASELGIPTLSYVQMLGRLMRDRQGVAVAGTHGKSTTTAMLGHLLVLAGQDPTVVYGAIPLGQASGGRAGHGPHVVVEACEYRANFLQLRPQQAVILNVEPDHFDHYHSLEQLHQAFARFAAMLPPDGTLLLPYGDPVTGAMVSGLACRVETFGADSRADWSLRFGGFVGGCPRLEVKHLGHSLFEVALPVPGRHNGFNALAAAALAWGCGVSAETIAAGLASFPGLHRRLERRGTREGVTLLDDYAHHPTEVTAALQTVRQMEPGRRLWCVFQPHQASRTAHLLDELAGSLENADKVVVAEIFRARELPPRPGEVTAADLAARLRARGRWVADGHGQPAIVRLLATALEPGDVLITLGAGDIRKLSDEFLDRF